MRAAIAIAGLVLVQLASAGAEVPRVEPAAAPAVARGAHTATAVGERVLIAGGCVVDGCSRATATTEIWHDGSFAPGPRLTVARDGHTATLLRNGEVMLVGGWRAEGAAPLASAELCSLTRCRVVARLATGRGGHRAVRLGHGGLLVIGGDALGGVVGTVELYDRRRGRFITRAPLLYPRAGHTATLLGDGRVLVVGGYGADGRGVPAAELYDARRDRWVSAGRLAVARGKHAAIRLHDGRILVIGGSTDRETRARLRSTEIFDPATRRFVRGPVLAVGRYKIVDAVALLADGQVVVGGDSRNVELVSPTAQTVSRSAGAVDGRYAFATATAVRDGVLLVGGYDEAIGITGRSYLVRP
jgi:hypothetical protein